MTCKSRKKPFLKKKKRKNTTTTKQDNTTAEEAKKNKGTIYISTAYSVCCQGKLLWIVFSCASARGQERGWSEFPLFSPPCLYWITNNTTDPPHPSAYWLMLCLGSSVETPAHRLHLVLIQHGSRILILDCTVCSIPPPSPHVNFILH